MARLVRETLSLAACGGFVWMCWQVALTAVA
ncbi:hypothetical protein GGR12_001885 [Brevundimonas lenta]|uniref:Cell division inhibitor SidA n=1 Tax=Brevundimonas lenta TaxID=424796 RepID=A0A7W6JDA8_9CAUL|nr:hypothetical protein [Brevundimonas lenta]